MLREVFALFIYSKYFSGIDPTPPPKSKEGNLHMYVYCIPTKCSWKAIENPFLPNFERIFDYTIQLGLPSIIGLGPVTKSPREKDS